VGGKVAKEAKNNFLVSGTGGAGTSGQPARYAAGIDNAEDFYEMQTAAKMQGQNPAFSNVPSPSSQRPFRGDSAQPLVPLNAGTQRLNEDVRTGATMGTEAMYANDATATGEDADRMRAALPYLSVMAELPQTSNAFRNYVRYLKSVL
jgi:hypothetical protein